MNIPGIDLFFHVFLLISDYGRTQLPVLLYKNESCKFDRTDNSKNPFCASNSAQFAPTGGKLYKLPSAASVTLPKITILDPSAMKNWYNLPTYNSVVTEKVTPAWQNIYPISDPDPLQKVIDQGMPTREIYTMPLLVTIRHKKMKKHKLKKLRKRMRFLYRRLKLEKKKKKEYRLQQLCAAKIASGNAFDAEAYIAQQIEAAKRGGFKIDIFANRSQ